MEATRCIARQCSNGVRLAMSCIVLLYTAAVNATEICSLFCVTRLPATVCKYKNICNPPNIAGASSWLCIALIVVECRNAP